MSSLARMENSDLITRVASIGLHEWGLYNVLLASGETIVNFTKYAAIFGTTDKTIRKYFAKLVSAGLIRLDGNSVIFTDGLVFTGTYISYNVNVTNDIKDIVPVKSSKRSSSGSLAYWCSAYFSRYGVKYTASSWSHEQRSIKLLDARHSDRLKPIMDVVLRLYETRWYSQNYPRPTLGAMVSWLAVQAEGYVPANLPEIAASDQPDETSLSAFDDKFGLGGDDVDKI